LGFFALRQSVNQNTVRVWNVCLLACGNLFGTEKSLQLFSKREDV
jgi:hypothetical protein